MKTNNLADLRKHTGLKQADIARALGVTTGQVSKWEAGKSNIPLKRLEAVAAAYQVEVSDILKAAVQDLLITTEHLARREGISLPPSNARVVPMEGASEERMRQDLPVFGTALGAPRVVEGEAIEQTTLNRGEIIHYARRPVILDGRADAYGLYVAGSSMAPVHLEGDMILAETRRPPRVGEDVVVYLRPKSEEEDDGERARGVLIKRLVRRTSGYIELEQFNPPMIFRIPTEDVLRTDRVLRLADLIG